MLWAGRHTKPCCAACSGTCSSSRFTGPGFTSCRSLQCLEDCIAVAHSHHQASRCRVEQPAYRECSCGNDVSGPDLPSESASSRPAAVGISMSIAGCRNASDPLPSGAASTLTFGQVLPVPAPEPGGRTPDSCCRSIFSIAFSSTASLSRRIRGLMVSTAGIKGSTAAASASTFMRAIFSFSAFTRRRSSHLRIHSIAFFSRNASCPWRFHSVYPCI